MTRTEKNFRIWFAGFFDGEGSIGIYFTHKIDSGDGVRRYQWEPKFSVYQDSESLIREIHTKLGGNIHRCGGKDGRAWACVWTWRRAIFIARYLQPYSKVKREQVDAFLDAMRQWGRYVNGNRRLPDAVVAARHKLAKSVNSFNRPRLGQYWTGKLTPSEAPAYSKPVNV